MIIDGGVGTALNTCGKTLLTGPLDKEEGVNLSLGSRKFPLAKG